MTHLLASLKSRMISMQMTSPISASITDEEFCRWKSRWLSVLQKDRPETLTDSLKQCCPQSLPNTFTLLKLFSTSPF